MRNGIENVLRMGEDVVAVYGRLHASHSRRKRRLKRAVVAVHEILLLENA